MQAGIERRRGSTAGRYGSRVDQAAMLVLAMGLDEAPRLLNRLPPSDAQRVGAAVAALRPGLRSGLLAGRVNLVVGEFLESVSADADGADAFLKRLFDGALPNAPGGSRFVRLVGRGRARLQSLARPGAAAIARVLRVTTPSRREALLACIEPSLAAAVRRRLGSGGCAP